MYPPTCGPIPASHFRFQATPTGDKFAFQASALFLPRNGRKYQSGFYDVGGIKLHVNRGVGTVNVPLRLFCPPEISCFDITNAATIA
jgi:predicted MPP superfamily phosphohydrolase